MKLVGSFEESVNIINHLAKNIDLVEEDYLPTLIDEDAENFGSFWSKIAIITEMTMYKA